MEKELRRLNRRELIEILYEQAKRLDEAEAEARRLREKLEQRESSLTDLGSIAEASLQLNGVFTAAQAAADAYLAAARQQADALLQKAQTESAALTAAAKEQVEALWQDFEERTNVLIAAHRELQVNPSDDR